MSEDPEIYLFRKWMTSQKYERILKNRYKTKRIRGEWFALNADDLKEIDELMSKFYNSVETGITGLVTKILHSLTLT